MSDNKEQPKYEPAGVPCRDCKAPIRFIKSPKSGKNMPVDAKPIKVVTPEGRVIQAFTPHWETCPEIEKHSDSSINNHGLENK